MPGGQGKDPERFGDAERFGSSERFGDTTNFGDPERFVAAELFAAAVEQGRPPRHSDAELARDLDVVAMLRRSGAALDPDPAAKARAKQRLMAALAAGDAPAGRPERDTEITARIAPLTAAVAHDTGRTDPGIDDTRFDGEDGPRHGVGTRRARRSGRHTMPTRPARSARSARPVRRSALRRAVMAGSAALLAAVALAGTGAFASRNALPGDGLYGVKRAAESAGIALTFDDDTRASRHLELATTRLGEVERLVDQKRTTQADPALVQDAITDFDSAADAGSRLMLTDQDAHDPKRLAELQRWASDQVSRLSAMRSGLPESAQPDADRAIDQLDKLLSRSATLEDRATCSDVTSGAADEVGPLPARTPCSTSPSPTGTTAAPGTTDGTTTAPGEDATTRARPSSSAPSSTSGGPAATNPAGPLGGVVGTDPTPGLDTPAAPTDLLPVDPSAPAGSVPGTSAGGSGPSQVSVPLSVPLLPPITLPALAPGVPSITIG